MPIGGEGGRVSTAPGNRLHVDDRTEVAYGATNCRTMGRVERSAVKNEKKNGTTVGCPSKRMYRGGKARKGAGG